MYLIFRKRHLEQFPGNKLLRDDLPHQREGTYSTAEEDPLDSVNNADVLRRLDKVKNYIVEPGSSEVFSLEFVCKHRNNKKIELDIASRCFLL